MFGVDAVTCAAPYLGRAVCSPGGAGPCCRCGHWAGGACRATRAGTWDGPSDKPWNASPPSGPRG
eukprot:3515646-Alexandrium_andersonii.AAC.1